jgi:NADH-quinone oxidoreductase subunit L
MNTPVDEAWIWLIFFLPVASFFAITVGLRHAPALAARATIGAIGAAFVVSVYILIELIGENGHVVGFSTHELFSAGDLIVNVGARLDGLTAVMLVIVTGISLLVQVYSLGYMRGDHGFARYYAFMSLFTAAMLGLIIADNLLLLFVFWELVGIASYLLIGFWFHRPAAAAAAKKAFIVTRFGDVGLLAALILIWDRAGTLDIAAINTEVIELVGLGVLSQTMLTLFALGLAAGAIGKSAQFPLHIWLPDAMEGPTPVSALVHSATMVAAGVYLLARFFPVIEASDFASDFIAWIGAVTALGAALLAVVQTDIKRVLAYSTISQLAYMVFALGIGAYAAALFHLMTHAFFKALLFLGSGSVNHATNTFDMRKMGGLRTMMPITYATFLIGALSLSGVIPLAGFWSKDEILIDAWRHNKAIFAFGLAAAGLTAFYMFRAIALTFHGDYKGGQPAPGGQNDHDPAHPHESERTMTVPLLVLAVLAVVAGWITIDGEFQSLVLGALPDGEEGEFLWDTGIFIASTLMVVAGIAGAIAIYVRREVDPAASRERRLIKPMHQLLENKYYADVLAEDILVKRVFYNGIARAAATFDRVVIDGAVNLTAYGVYTAGWLSRFVQNGQAQTAAAMLFAGGIIAFGAVVIFQ